MTATLRRTRRGFSPTRSRASDTSGRMTDDLALALARAQSAFLGLAIGDALGASVEFMEPEAIARAHPGGLTEIVGGGWLHLPAGAVTDDTQMAVALARAIAKPRWRTSDIAASFAAWFASMPPDVGGTCARGILRWVKDRSVEAPLEERAAGNGAAMRVLPVALRCMGDEEWASLVAVQQARVTHNNPTSDAACQLIVRLVQMGLAGYDKEDLLLAALEAVEREPALTFDGYAGPTGGYVAETMRVVLNEFFNSDSFERCLIQVANRGGDADTAGAIAGAIAGAFYGLEGIPERWARALDAEVTVSVMRLGEELLGLSPFAAVETRGAPGMRILPRR